MLTLYIPELKDYWYEQKLESDPKTMEYNAGYNVSYYGYHYDTGCIDFPIDRWQAVYEKRIKENRYFAYLKNEETNEFVGYVNYQFDKSSNRYECGIVIEAKHRGNGFAKEGLKLLIEKAKSDGITALYDSFEKDRPNIKVFEDVGFKIIENTTWKKFDKEVEGIVVKKEL